MRDITKELILAKEPVQNPYATNWIQNVSMKAFATGNHFDPGYNAVAIQIVDPASSFPQPKFPFRAIDKFEFLDVDEPTNTYTQEMIDAFGIQDEQARRIVLILQEALENKRNVIVHCHAGMCRSGAVAEIGIMMGFNDTGTYRQPNILVKKKLMQALGWTYD